MQNPALLSNTYTSIDELMETSGLELDFCQLEVGKPVIKSRISLVSSVVSHEFKINKAFHQQGKLPNSFLSFGLMQGNSRIRFTGKDIGSECLIDFNSRSGFETVSDKNFHAKLLMVNEHKLHNTAESAGINLPKFGMEDFATPKQIRASNRDQLQIAIRQFEEVVSTAGLNMLASEVTKVVEEDVYLKLACFVEEVRNVRADSRLNRLAAMRRAIDFIKSHSRESILVTNLCRITGTSNRTLERVFREELGITPKKYIKLVKLTGAREDLCRAGPEKSVHEIAHSWGFWHMGQFACDYKAHFGESPSQTLNQH